MDNPGTRARSVLLVVLPYRLGDATTDSSKKAIRSFLAFPYGVLTLASYLKRFASNLSDVEVLDLNLPSVDSPEAVLNRKLAVMKPDLVGFSMSYDVSYSWLKSLAATRKASFGAETGGGMAPDGTALIGYYRERIAQLRQFVADQDLVTLPAWLGAIDVVETPKFLQPVSPGASMESPRLFAKATNGYYFITPPESLKAAAERLDMNEDFDRDRILSTAAHEAMPGHFLQLSIARRHSDYIRKIQYSGPFAEGWAFYGEEMFLRLGLYGDDLDARLFTARWERVRGARVIVDVKMATGEWTIAQAARFFEEQSGFTKSASEAAVAGYALRPGYVLAYTVGRLQLEALLGEYQRRMGDKGSLRDFHDRLLSYGSVPFSIVGPELLADLDKPASAVRAAANY